MESCCFCFLFLFLLFLFLFFVVVFVVVFCCCFRCFFVVVVVFNVVILLLFLLKSDKSGACFSKKYEAFSADTTSLGPDTALNNDVNKYFKTIVQRVVTSEQFFHDNYF